MGFAAVLLAVGGPQLAGAHPSALEQIEALEAVIRARPDDPVGYIRRGQAYSNEAHYEEALADFHRAEQLGDPVDVAYDLGVLHYRMGALERAREFFDRWLVRHPGHPAALQYRARVLRDAGQSAPALADYRAYFEAQPRPNPGDYRSAARLLVGEGDTGIVEALAMLDAGMRRLGTVPQLQREAISLERRRGDLGAATARLETLRASLGESPDWKVDMGELLLLRGDGAGARVHFEAAAAQLARSRSTTARVKLKARLDRLEAAAVGASNVSAR
jgi:tetratricopeptide (TPR) repeat protein